MKYIMKILLYPFKKIFQWTQKRKLNRFLNKTSISKIDSLSGYDFEEYVAALFESSGFKCDKTPKSKDNGVDIIAYKNNLKIAIQTKLYYNHKVSNSAIQQVYTGKIFYNCNIGIVVTNSTFSKSATTLAQSLNIALFDRKLLESITNSNTKDKKYILENLMYNNLNNEKTID